MKPKKEDRRCADITGAEQSSQNPSTTANIETTISKLEKTTASISSGSTTCTMVKELMVTSRRQSIESIGKQESFGARSRRSRSVSTTTTSIQNSFVLCSATENGSHPLSCEAGSESTVSNEGSGTRDIQLNVVFGFNHSLHRNVKKMTPKQLPEQTKGLPYCDNSNTTKKNDKKNLAVVATTGKLVASPKPKKKKTTKMTEARPRKAKSPKLTQQAGVLKPKKKKATVKNAKTKVKKKIPKSTSEKKNGITDGIMEIEPNIVVEEQQTLKSNTETKNGMTDSIMESEQKIVVDEQQNLTSNTETKNGMTDSIMEFEQKIVVDEQQNLTSNTEMKNGITGGIMEFEQKIVADEQQNLTSNTDTKNGITGGIMEFEQKIVVDEQQNLTSNTDTKNGITGGIMEFEQKIVVDEQQNLTSNTEMKNDMTYSVMEFEPNIAVEEGQATDIEDETVLKQLPPSNEASTNELKSLLSFLTPYQINCLQSTYNIKRLEDLMYFNLWQLYKMGIRNPEFIIALMKMATSANVQKGQDDVIYISDDDDGESINLVIDEDIKMEIEEDLHENGLLPHDANIESNKEQSNDNQKYNEYEFQNLLKKCIDISCRIIRKMLCLKKLNLQIKAKCIALSSTHESFIGHEKFIKDLWENLLNISDERLNEVLPEDGSEDAYLTTLFLYSDDDKSSINNDKDTEYNNNDTKLIKNVSSPKSEEYSKLAKGYFDYKFLSQTEPEINIVVENCQNSDAINEINKLSHVGENNSINQDLLELKEHLIELSCHAEEGLNEQQSLNINSNHRMDDEVDKCMENMPEENEELEGPVIEEDLDANKDEDEESPVYELLTATTSRKTIPHRKHPYFRRKSPRLQWKNQESEATTTIEHKNNARDLCLPKSLDKEVNTDPRKMSKNTVYSHLLENKDTSSGNLLNESLAQNVDLVGRYLENKAESKSILLSSTADNVDFKEAEPLLIPPEFENKDIEQTVQTPPSEGFEGLKDSEDNIVDNSKDREIITSNNVENTKSTDNEVSQKFDFTLTSLNKVEVDLNANKEMKCNEPKISKFEKEDAGLGNCSEDICYDYSQKRFEILSTSRSNYQTINATVDTNTTDYCSSSECIDITDEELYSGNSQIDYIDTQQDGHKKCLQIVASNITKLDLQQEKWKTETTLKQSSTMTADAAHGMKKQNPEPPYFVFDVLKQQQSPLHLSSTDFEENPKMKKSRRHSHGEHIVSSRYVNQKRRTDRSFEDLQKVRIAVLNNPTSHTVKRQISVESTPVYRTPITSPTNAGPSSPSPMRNGEYDVLGARNNQLDVEIDGRITYPPIPYRIYKIDVSRNYLTKIVDINKFSQSNSQRDPRIFRNHTPKATSTAARKETYMESKSATYTEYSVDPRCRTLLAEAQHPLPPTSPQASLQNAVVCFNPSARSEISVVAAGAEYRSKLQSGLMQSNVTSTFQQTQIEDIIKKLNNYLHVSPWYQSLVITIKMQINQTITQLVRAITKFRLERVYNPEAVFDVFTMDCAGEILEILSNLGLIVDTNGAIIDEGQMAKYAARRGASTLEQPKVQSGVDPPVNATYSFMQQILAPSIVPAYKSLYNTTTGPINAPNLSNFLGTTELMRGGECQATTCMAHVASCCGASTSAVGCNVSAIPGSVSKGCGCSTNTTCMNHHYPNHEGQHKCQGGNHHHSQNKDISFEDVNSPDDRQYNQSKKAYKNNDDSFQRSSNNDRYSNNSRYSKASSAYSDTFSSRRSNSPTTMSSSPPRGNGRGGGRGRGGGFGRFNRGHSERFGGRNNNNDRFNKSDNNDGNYSSSYNNLPSPPPAQKSPPPLSPSKKTDIPGSPVLNSPPRQQNGPANNIADEENWD